MASQPPQDIQVCLSASLALPALSSLRPEKTENSYLETWSHVGLQLLVKSQHTSSYIIIVLIALITTNGTVLSKLFFYCYDS